MLAAATAPNQVVEVEPNDTVSTATTLENASWSLGANPDIGNAFSNTSSTIPHVTVYGSTNPTGANSFDYYSFNVPTPNSQVILDIDHGINTVVDIEPNNTIATAQTLELSTWSLDSHPNIGDAVGNTSTTIPHISVIGNGGGGFDYFSFKVESAGDRGIFDIDNPFGGADTYIAIYDVATSRPVFNAATGLKCASEDSPTTVGSGGSGSLLDSFVDCVFPARGNYVVGVARGGSTSPNGGLAGTALLISESYTLHVSMERVSAQFNRVEPELEPNSTLATAQSTDRFQFTLNFDLRSATRPAIRPRPFRTSPCAASATELLTTIHSMWKAPVTAASSTSTTRWVPTPLWRSLTPRPARSSPTRSPMLPV